MREFALIVTLLVSSASVGQDSKGPAEVKGSKVTAVVDAGGHTADIDALLHPARAYHHPRDVVADG